MKVLFWLVRNVRFCVMGHMVLHVYRRVLLYKISFPRDLYYFYLMCLNVKMSVSVRQDELENI